MTAPGRADVERELARARAELDLADAADGDAERHSRLTQAAQALANAGRITGGLAKAAEPPAPSRWGMDMVLPRRIGGALSGPGPR